MEKKLIEKIYKIKRLSELTQEERDYIKFKYAQERDFFDIVHQWKKLSFFENYGPDSPNWLTNKEFLTGVRHGISIAENENIDMHQIADWLSIEQLIPCKPKNVCTETKINTEE